MYLENILSKTAYIGEVESHDMIKEVRKRDGELTQPFNIAKLKNAIKAAMASCGVDDARVATHVLNTTLSSLDGETVDVETIQDAVETSFMHHRQFAAAKAYILYRHERMEARQARQAHRGVDPLAVSNYIHAGKYARYLPELKRREVYEETVARVEDMHVSQFPNMAKEIHWAFDMVRAKRLLPSMRSFQFAGAAILQNHCRQYNCSSTHVDRIEAFSEALFLLLSGCGVGYSVQFDHVEKLPVIPFVDATKIRHHVVKDTIEGWADALKALFQSYLDGVYLEFAYNRIRPAGTPLVTSGGRAPGHRMLKVALEAVRGVLDSVQGRRLRPIECHRIMCHAADAVLSGGIRRSAMISLFSLEDSEMMNCKTGNWFAREPWLANANNSVVLKRDDVRKKSFKRIFKMTREFGEPGFYFTEDLNYTTNPCAEISMNPRICVDKALQDKLAADGIKVELGSEHSGYSFCNLVEINAAKLTSLEDFLEVAKAATLIGTMQATYTDMPYLGWASEAIAKRDALLGVGMTGMLDSPAISCNPEYQRKVAENIKVWNVEYAARLGINTAARTTCIKPSGTTSLALGCVASGHHAHHARRYIRRVTADPLEFVFQAFKAQNPHMCVRKPDGKFIIEFPVEAPDGATVKADILAVPFLNMIRSTQQNWVIPGTARTDGNPGLHHNVSNTVTVKADEWDKVADYLWENREFFTGVSLLSDTGDKDYAFSPMEAVVTDADEARWNAILAAYKPVDYMSLVEETDATDLRGEIACAGGACLI